MANRVSQVSTETLIVGASTARASQVDVEALIEAPADAHVSQAFVEVLIARRSFTVEPAAEADAAQPLAWHSEAVGGGVTLTPAAEADAAQPLAAAKRVTLTPAAELDTAARLVDWLALEPARERDEAAQLVYGPADVRLTQLMVEVTGTGTVGEAQLTQAYLEVVHQAGGNLLVWARF